jgi:hypothetical protein
MILIPPLQSNTDLYRNLGDRFTITATACLTVPQPVARASGLSHILFEPVPLRHRRACHETSYRPWKLVHLSDDFAGWIQFLGHSNARRFEILVRIHFAP